MIPKTIGHVVKFKNSIGGLFQKACWEIPEVVGASFMALIGFGLAGVGLYNYSQNDGESREYKMVYYIVRDGDQRMERIRNPVETEYPPSPEDKDNLRRYEFLYPKET